MVHDEGSFLDDTRKPPSLFEGGFLVATILCDYVLRKPMRRGAPGTWREGSTIFER